MWYSKLRPERLLRGTDTMLGQVRTLFLGFLAVWPVFGFWGIEAVGGRRIGVAVAAAVTLVAWCYAGYRWQRFPAWSWIPRVAINSNRKRADPMAPSAKEAARPVPIS